MVAFNALDMAALLNQAIVEVQYDRGASYFDKCGSLALALQDELGKAFEWSLPNVEFGQLQSPAERLVIRYSSKSFNVTQAWVSSPARVQLVAPQGWQVVAAGIGVERYVTRCGVRFSFAWPARDLNEAANKITSARLFTPTTALNDLVSSSRCFAWSTITEDDRGRLRLSLEAVETKVQSESLPAGLAKVVPAFALLLDLDHVYPGEAPFKLTSAQLKDFIRDSWQRSKSLARFVGASLSVE